MALLGMQDVTIAFGGPPVLDWAGFSMERGERVCLLGRNGAGKTTVMKLLEGTIAPDSGEIVRQTGITIARLEQQVPQDISGSTYDVVAAGLGPAGLLLARYHQAGHDVAAEATEGALRELDRLHHALDAAGAWQMQTRVETVLSHLGWMPMRRFPSRPVDASGKSSWRGPWSASPTCSSSTSPPIIWTWKRSSGWRNS
jgi:ATP-binding cassette subfamily F protein uup